MISKFEIAQKEASETDNWLNILLNSNIITHDEFTPIYNKLVKILLIKSIKTLKSKNA